MYHGNFYWYCFAQAAAVFPITDVLEIDAEGEQSILKNNPD